MNKKECSVCVTKNNKKEIILISKLDMVILSELKKHRDPVSSSDLLKIDNIREIINRQSLTKIVTRLVKLELIYKTLISNNNYLKISDIINKDTIPSTIIHKRKWSMKQEIQKSFSSWEELSEYFFNKENGQIYFLSSNTNNIHKGKINEKYRNNIKIWRYIIN